jgi:hypothetical protein
MLKTPSTKAITGVIATGGAMVLGAKIGDGIAAIMPDSTKAYKKWAIAGVSMIAAASMSTTSTTGKVAVNALVGMGVKQLYDELSGALEVAIPIKENTSTANRFVNAIVGHTDPMLIGSALNGSWLGESDMWNQPETQSLPGSFSGI